MFLSSTEGKRGAVNKLEEMSNGIDGNTCKRCETRMKKMEREVKKDGWKKNIINT